MNHDPLAPTKEELLEAADHRPPVAVTPHSSSRYHLVGKDGWMRVKGQRVYVRVMFCQVGTIMGADLVTIFHAN